MKSGQNIDSNQINLTDESIHPLRLRGSGRPRTPCPPSADALLAAAASRASLSGSSYLGGNRVVKDHVEKITNSVVKKDQDQDHIVKIISRDLDHSKVISVFRFRTTYLLAYLDLRTAWSLAHSARWLARLWCVSSDEETAR